MPEKSAGPKGASPSDTEAGQGEMRRRLETLERRLTEARGQAEAAEGKGPGEGRSAWQDGAAGKALRIGSELIAGVAVGGFIGWWLDGFFGTAPWLLIIFFGLGILAGLLNVVRSAQRLAKDGADETDTKPGQRP